MDPSPYPQPQPSQPAKRKNMSLESALDEERREVMDALEGTTAESKGPPPGRGSDDSSISAVRSMLDICSDRGPPHGSIVGIGVGPVAGATGSPTSPAQTSPMATTTPQSMTMPQHVGKLASPSHGSSQGLPRAATRSSKDFDQTYQFNMSPGTITHAPPKRLVQGGPKSKDHLQPSAAMAAVMSGGMFAVPGLPLRDVGRHNSTVGIGGKSKSPSSRISHRTLSPGASILKTSKSASQNAPGKYLTDSGKCVDLDRAYRSLSTKSGSSVSDVDVRVQEDPIEGGTGENGVVSSEEDQSSSDEEDGKPDGSRGRRRYRSKKESAGSETDESVAGECSTMELGKCAAAGKAKSQLAAAEEERKTVSSKYPDSVRSLLEPSISVTTPTGEKVTPKKPGVHPHTSYDEGAAAMNSTEGSDLEGDIPDIKRAQKLSINISPLESAGGNRVVRTILRGDFATLQEEGDEGLRRQRLYLVATDLSDEAAYALEWTIGTILRDGDTLLAMYAIDEEQASTKGGDVEAASAGEGTKTVQDAVKSVEPLSENAKQSSALAHEPSPTPVQAGYVPATETVSLTGSVDARMVSKTDLERFHAIEEISKTCVRLLRKTRLQVRVAIEVIHCKIPKHMITEAIDELEPTLVVLGSRGRSALKGVLLGSFSNYLVTKSSVPVMVARKRLKKHAKSKGTTIRLSNNLTTPGQSPRLLSRAKID